MTKLSDSRVSGDGRKPRQYGIGSARGGSLQQYECSLAAVGVAGAGVSGESRPSGIVANTAAGAVCIISGLPIIREGLSSPSGKCGL